MKYYGIRSKNNKETKKYLTNQIKMFISYHFTFNTKKQKEKKFWYNQLFNKNYETKIKKNLSIPNSKYYTPVFIVMNDLIAKENVIKLKKGLKKLILNNITHKFLAIPTSISDIIEQIDRMNETLTYYNSYVDCGRFDFAKNRKLNKYIEYFAVNIKNFNASYFSIEIQVYLSKSIENKLNTVINNDYKQRKGFVKECLSNSSKKSGCKKSIGMQYCNNASLKTEVINNILLEIKWYLFNELSKYFPVILHKKNIVPPSVTLYKTNILYDDESADFFWESVGVNYSQGQFLSDSEKIFFETDIVYNNEQTDMIFIVNDESYEKQTNYYNDDYKWLLKRDFSTKYNELYKLYLAKRLNEAFASSCSKYRNKINKIKLKKRNLSKLLKIRYKFEKEMDWFKRFIETDWESEQKRVEDMFDKKQYKKSYDYRIVSEYPIKFQTKIKNSYNNIEKDIMQKLSIIEHAYDYSRERKNLKINLVMLVISLITLVFVIFPKWANQVAIYIKQIVN